MLSSRPGIGKTYFCNHLFTLTKMKTLLLAPALVSFINTDFAVDPNDVKPVSAPALFAFTEVVKERPIVELQDPPPFLPVVAKEDDAKEDDAKEDIAKDDIAKDDIAKDDNRLLELKADLGRLAESLKTTQHAVQNVAQQRDEAREEVRALAIANHEMLKEMKAFRQEMAVARQETEKWKAQAAAMERKVNDRALADADLHEFRNELQGALKDLQSMKGDIAKARDEFQDPIERANLKEQLAAAEKSQDRLGDEIEMALIAREKTIQESARTRKELEGKMATLMKQAQSAQEMRDELRSTNAVKMKALADVEVLRKELQKSQEGQQLVRQDLAVARDGLEALQAEKAAAMEAKAVASLERDEAQAGLKGLEGQIEEVRQDAETARQAVADVAEKLKFVQTERETAGKELAEAAGVLQKTVEEITFLNKAKGGLEELLFKKTAEIRMLKGELRKVQASRQKSPELPEDSPRPDDAEEPEPVTAQAVAD